jgi:hypothetical protein
MNRNRCINSVLPRFVCLVYLAGLSIGDDNAGEATEPNIVLIEANDLGCADLPAAQ